MGMGDSNRRRHLLSLVAIVMVVGAFVTAPPGGGRLDPRRSVAALAGSAREVDSHAFRRSFGRVLDRGRRGGRGHRSPCPSPSFFGQSLVQVPVPLGRFTFTEAETANYAPEDVCAYVVHESAVTASAGLVVKTVPSLEEREEAAAPQVPVKSLSVRVVSHFGQTTSAAGFATLYVTTSPFAYVTVRLSRFGHRAEHLEWGRAETARASVVRWTCSRPGGTYRYQSPRGPTWEAHSSAADGSLRSALRDVTPWSARKPKLEERDARAYAERVRREERKAREKLEQWEGNCRALGGTPVTLHTSEGAERACRSPRGGLLPAPV